MTSQQSNKAGRAVGYIVLDVDSRQPERDGAPLVVATGPQGSPMTREQAESKAYRLGRRHKGGTYLLAAVIPVRERTSKPRTRGRRG